MIYLVILSYYATQSPHEEAMETRFGERLTYWKDYRFHHFLECMDQVCQF
jgi:hypothetical protein